MRIGLFVVLDDEHGVAEIAELAERAEQPPVVALMQPDRRLVEHVEHAGQLRADLRRQADPLAFSAGERRGARGRASDSRRRRRSGSAADRESRAATRSATRCSRSVSCRCSTTGSASEIGRSTYSERRRPLTRTARLSGRRRAPSHAGHGCSPRNRLERFLIGPGPLVEAPRRFGMTPSKSTPNGSFGARTDFYARDLRTANFDFASRLGPGPGRGPVCPGAPNSTMSRSFLGSLPNGSRRIDAERPLQPSSISAISR